MTQFDQKTDPASDPLDLALLRLAHRNNLTTMVVQIAASIGVVLAAHRGDHPVYLTWLGVVLALAAARLLVDRKLASMLSASPTPPWPQLNRWSQAHAGGLILSAALCAGLAWKMLPVENAESQFVIIIILSALSGGAIGVLAPMKLTGRIYVSLMLAPACAQLLMLGGPQAVLGLLGLVFWGVMLVGHHNNHTLTVRSINLGRENLSLIRRLKEHADEVEEMNHTLEQRVAERTVELRDLAVQAQAANRAKSEFLATISHEIRTPLNGVLGMVQILERGKLDDLQRGRVSVIRASAQMLLGILNDVLDISKIEAGALSLSSAPFDLAPFGEGLRRLYEPLAQEKGLTFTLTVTETEALPRIGDEVRLRQILSNLISNALKFTDEGSIRVEINAHGDDVVMSVHDTGVGIAPQDQAQVFDKFVQADGSHNRRAGGTGLGLAICRDLATLMKGEIDLISAPGVGSTFTLRLPLPTAERREVRPAPAAVTPRGPKVLIVDDNATNRMVLQSLLLDYGVAAQTAENGAEAVDAWADREWNAILMDISMPVMNGMEATLAIRERERETGRGHTPIIAVTASAMSHETEAYLAAGMDAVVAKPVDADTLMAILTDRMRLAA
ncbi:ATP-binding protein [Phenylobacterium conjunctum]|uniref:histidine kinase n=1 Tax=Phenylobacterium conjunctum TaxID=1298959 RepID=A0ABW3T1H1_9CAUL